MGLIVWWEILSNGLPPWVVPFSFSLNDRIDESGVMLAVKWTRSLCNRSVTSRMRFPSVVMSCSRRELVSTFSDPARVMINSFDLPAKK